MSLTLTPMRRKLLPLLQDLNELKRMRPAPSCRSLAEQSFLRAWAALRDGAELSVIAWRELDSALVASRLGGTDLGLLTDAGLTPADARAVCERAREDALARAGDWASALISARADELPPSPTVEAPPPPFAELLARQPRAPATRADRTRVSVDPPENHAEHCAAVAVAGVVMAVAEGACVGTVFVAALGHHLHNAYLPDGGFAGEAALGEHLPTVVRTLRRRALQELPPSIAELVEAAAAATVDVTTPEGRAFHAADVVDRVLQTYHHARMAAFTVEQALDEHGLVHEGPLQRFHQTVLAEIGL